ncbi:hypothetical protein ACOME3_010561 [Neoechinorhynchus agilis]
MALASTSDTPDLNVSHILSKQEFDRSIIELNCNNCNSADSFQELKEISKSEMPMPFSDDAVHNVPLSVKRHMSIGLTSTPKRRLSSELSEMVPKNSLTRSTTVPVGGNSQRLSSFRRLATLNQMRQTECVAANDSVVKGVSEVQSSEYGGSVRVFPHNDSLALLRAGNSSMETEANRKIIERADQELSDLLNEGSDEVDNLVAVRGTESLSQEGKQYSVERAISPIPKPDEDSAVIDEHTKKETETKETIPLRTGNARPKVAEKAGKSRKATKTAEVKDIQPVMRRSLRSVANSHKSSVLTTKSRSSKKNWKTPMPSVHRMVTRSSAIKNKK